MLLFAFAVQAAAQGGWTAQGPGEPTPPSSGKPLALEKVSIEQRLNEQLPLDLTFRNEQGETVRLGDYFGKKPVVLSLVYYSCPQLCNQVLNGLTSSLITLSDFDIGKEFEVVTVSFDAREKAELAAEKKKPYVHWYKRDGAAEGWHFLTGDQAAIDRSFILHTSSPLSQARDLVELVPSAMTQSVFQIRVLYWEQGPRFKLVEKEG